MFGLDKKTILKRNIVDILDMELQPVSSRELRQKIGEGSSALILDTCKEIQETFSNVYPDGRVKLLIEKNGITLLRTNSSLQYFFESLFSQDLSYQIIKTLIVHRIFHADDFCFQNGVSLSTLRRKIQMINQSLLNYRIHITVSNRTSFVGAEIDIRNMTNLFLLGIHRQFSRIPWVANKSFTLDLAKDILEKLAIPHFDIQVEELAIWLFCINLSRSHNQELQLDEYQASILETMEFPEQPESLFSWSQLDWHFLYVVICTSDMYEVPITIQTFENTRLEAFYHKISDGWLETFEEYFKILDESEQECAKQKIYQQFMQGVFVPQIDDLFTLTNSFNMNTFKKLFPCYATVFADFWASFLEKTNLNKVGNDYFRHKSLLLCLSICSTEEILPELKLFLYSDRDQLYNHYLKNRVKSILRSDYKIDFVENATDARFILSTVPIGHEKFDLQKVLLIKSPIRDADIREIRKLIKM